MNTARDPHKSIAIIGMGCRFPDAPTPAGLWANTLERRCSFRDVGNERWDHSLYLTSPRDPNGTYCERIAFIGGVDLFAARAFGISPRRAEVMDPQHRLVLEVVREALCDAGLEERPYARRQSAIFVGAGVSEYSRMIVGTLRARQAAAGEFGAASEQGRELFNRLPPTRAYTIPGSLMSMAASGVAQVLDLGGPSMAVDAACASSLTAVVHGVRYLRGLPPRRPTEPAPIALAGGVYLILLPDNMVGFARIGALARSTCRPFDAAAQGMLIGEGVGMVALKRTSEALADGDRIFATIEGVAWNSDGASDGPMTPVQQGQVELLRAGFADADLEPADIGYIEGHGTGTPTGDEAELRALSVVFDGCGHQPRLGSIKANIGHALSAAGVAGLIRAALAVYHGVLPPQASWERWPDAMADVGSHFRVEMEPRPWQDSPRCATVSAFGFGGTNAFALLRQAPTLTSPHGLDGRAGGPASGHSQACGGGPALFCVSAPNPALLEAYLADVAVVLGRLDHAALHEAAWTLGRTRKLSDYAAVFVARDSADAVEAIACLREALDDAPKRLARAGRLAFLGPVTSSPVPLALLFPGQAERRAIPWESLASRFPSLSRPSPQEGAEVLARDSDGAYGVALLAFEVALGRWLESCGIRAEAMVGHSLGEAAAATLAGWLDEKRIGPYVARRSAVVERLVTRPGGLIVARLPAAEAVERAAPLGLVVAGVNHPRQVLLAGEPDRLDDAEARLQQEGISCHRLDARHGFHSPLLEEAREEIERLAEVLPLAEPIPAMPRVFSTVAGIDHPAYRDDAEWIRALWRVQATRAVDFERAVRVAAEAPPHLWIELGPGDGLCQCVQAILGGPGLPPPASISIGEPQAEVAQALLILGCARILGHPVRLDEAFPPESRRVADLPVAPLERERYWGVAPAPEVGVRIEMELQSPSPAPSSVRPPSFRPAPGTCTAPSPPEPAGVLEEVLRLVSEVASWPHSLLGPQSRLSSHLGFDSLMMVELASHLRGRYGTVPDVPFWRSDPTIAALAKLVETAAATAPPGRPGDRKVESRIEDFDEVRAMEERVQQTGAVNPYFKLHEGIPGPLTSMQGRATLSFSHYNYLGLNGHEQVLTASAEAIALHGTSVSASRLVAGEVPLHGALEQDLADFLRCEAALVLVSGHATNVTTIAHLVGPGDLVLHDALIHDSAVQGMAASRATRRPFPHNDVEGLDRLLQEIRPSFRRVLILTEGVFSMDGDICPLAGLVALKERHGALLMVDEAHSLGVLGDTGRGVAEHAGIEPSRVDLWMGTLSKALASCGGYLAGTKRVIDYLRYTLPGFVYSVGVPPAAVAAARAALAILRREPERVQRLRQRARFFQSALAERGFDTGAADGTCVVPVILGSQARSLAWTDRLARDDIHVMPILHPAVEEGSCRLRFFITSEHTEEQLLHVVTCLSRLAREEDGSGEVLAAPR